MALPAQLKPIQHYLRTAQEHEDRDPVVAYYCRLYAMQTGMKLDSKTPECRKFLIKLMDQLESMKKEMSDHDSISQEVVGNAHIENYALKMFLYADNEDRGGRFHKNMIKSFYTSSLLLDVLSVFGELSEETSSELQDSQAPPRADPSGELLLLSPMTTRTRARIQVRPLGSDLPRVRDHRVPPPATTTTSTSHQGPTLRPTLQLSCLHLQKELNQCLCLARCPLSTPHCSTPNSRAASTSPRRTSPRPRSCVSTRAAPCSTRTSARRSRTSRKL
ncbi:vacuolar protein sorting-associated protein VTA1 homolog isoform X5 [Paralichthys olivaceus]|uniref:vacuolar protein sorting-associated protein VTA1 homolog isoform X5 n=1 Tax=Paralichthys olivaceus TaxID=8255 RepID=UPI003752283F